MRFPSQNKFVAWLESKQPDEWAGRALSLGDCPLAMYLREHGAPDPYVRPDKVARDSCWRYSHGSREPLPEWANTFANRVDREFKDSVSVSECLSVCNTL
jgi:hypothetical protein